MGTLIANRGAGAGGNALRAARPQIYSAFGCAPERLSAEQLARDVFARGILAVVLPDIDPIVDRRANSCAPGDVGFGGSWEKQLERLRSHS